MKKSRKAWLIICLILLTALFVSSCTCVYIYNLNIKAFWWSWFGSIWILDIIVGAFLFNSRSRTDEARSFWLFVLLILPAYGAIIVLFAGIKKNTEKEGINVNHAILLQAIFSARKSIKIYTNSMFVSYDTFNALMFANFKNIDIQILVSKQPKKYKQNLMLYNFDKFLDKPIKVNITNKQFSNSFIIIDDNEAINVDKNFNFSNIFSGQKLTKTNDVSTYLNQFELELKNSKNFALKQTKPKLGKRIKSGILNIFYLFY